MRQLFRLKISRATALASRKAFAALNKLDKPLIVLGGHLGKKRQ